MAKPPEVRKGQPSVQLDHDEFRRRVKERFYDPAFDQVQGEIDKILEVALDGYEVYRKSPRKRKAGPGFENPEMELAVEWLDARAKLLEAERAQKDPKGRTKLLLICGSMRNDKTCPGEMSKTFRLVTLAKETLEATGKCEVDLLDLSHLTSEYGRLIHPCKACVSTAMPLCNWPCSCYPNHAMGQVNDWMNEIYPRWVAAHGVMIVTPVNWYQAPAGLKAMIDRLVCADGGNPDPTRTNGKDPQKAKELELAGWDYPKHLAGRAFSVVVHGDAEGAETLRRSLTDWLRDLQLIPCEPTAELARYVGYYEPYAESHQALDQDQAFQQEVRNAALTLLGRVEQIRSGGYRRSDEGLEDPRPK